MAIELVVDVQYENAGNKYLAFSDLRDTYKEVVAKAEQDRIDSTFFGQIVRRMPSFGKLAIERVMNKFAHYMEMTDIDGSAKAMFWMKEIASMDSDLERRIKRKSAEMLDNFGSLADVEQVRTGKNKEGKYVVKLIFNTAYEPEKIDAYNEYDKENQIRISTSDAFSNKTEALRAAMWLAGAINIRHVDEDDLPK